MRKSNFYKFLFLSMLSMLILISGCKTKMKHVKTLETIKDSLENYPYWIAMMDDPNVNYYKAVEAFEKYWEHREKPAEDDGEAKDIYGKEKSKEEKEKEANRTIEYVYEYKQFLNWQQIHKNLINPDGRIMSPEEVIEQWKKLNTDTLQR